MTQVILENARIFDGVSEECPEGMTVLVEDEREVLRRDADPRVGDGDHQPVAV